MSERPSRSTPDESTASRERADVPVGTAGENDGPSPCGYTTYTRGETGESVPATGEGAEGLAADVWDALYGIEDPEMPVSIVDLGLIYGVDVADGDGASADDAEGERVRVDMTLTYSGCPAREMLTDEVRERAGAVEGVADVELRLVWSPPWTVDMVTEQGEADLREFGLSL